MKKPVDMTAHRKEVCSDFLTNAIDCGIAYWAKGRKFERFPAGHDREGFYTFCELKPHDLEGEAFKKGDPRNNWKTIGLPEIEAACVLLMSEAGLHLCGKQYIEDIRANWNDPDECRGDADTADVVVQIAMFGEVVFG